MIALSEKWDDFLIGKPESGMGYQVVTVILKDNRKFPQVIVISGKITQVRGYKSIPFEEHEISEIIVTHDKWDFNAEP